MIQAQTLEQLQAARHTFGSKTIALVPTMGALHSGHLALVAAAKKHADVVLLSIFVNPLQFSAGEDLEKYPRTLEHDLSLAEAAGVDLVFAPSVEEMYPPGQAITQLKSGAIGEVLEGQIRPHHFDGMLTVVARLFELTQPDFAVFGEKDAQQLFLVRRLASECNAAGQHPLQIIGVETVREPDGLALSSRNRFLGEAERATARVLSRALFEGATEETPAAALDAAAAVMATEPLAKLEYLALVDESTFLPVTENFRGRARLLVAAKVGDTRLIDNLSVDF